MKVSCVYAASGANSAAKNLFENKKNNSVATIQRNFNLNDEAPTVTSNSFQIQRKKLPSAMLNFGGKKNKAQQVFVGAEMPPYCKIGGVAAVMNDYKAFGQVMVLPYYNGNIAYNPETGMPTGKIAVHEYDPATGKPIDKFKEPTKSGVPIFTIEDLNKKSMEEIIQEKKFVELEKIAEKTMQWSMDDAAPIALYRVKGTNDYMVYTDATAKMPKPYSDNSYAFGLKSIATDEASWQGDSYAKFDKAFTELLPSITEIEGKKADGSIEKVKFEPETIVCSDQQTAYIPHYMAQKSVKNDPYYQDVKPSYVEHNVGLGYQGDTSKRNMFVNLAENAEQVRAASKDPEYLKAMQEGNSEDYFEKFIDKALVVVHKAENAQDKDRKAAIATNIPLQYADMDYLSHVSTVSEGYAEGIVNNKMVSPNFTEIHKKLKEKGKFSGILNPLNDPNISAYKQLPGFLTHFQETRIIAIKPEEVDAMKQKLGDKLQITTDKNGKQEFRVKNEHPVFEVFKPEMSLAEMKEVKRKNKINLFKRASKDAIQGEGRFNLLGKEAASKIYGHIDEKWVQKLEAKEDVKLFVGWGRGDLQKGLDTILGAFEKFGKTEEGKNSVLIVGGELDPKNDESKRVTTKLKELLNSDQFKGRVVYVDGFAPGFAMASAGDAAVFPSRFAPCELTDFEAQKYYCTPIVPNTQGMAQKNFDPRPGKPNSATEMAKATSYKTDHEFMMEHETLENASEKFKTEYQKLLKAEEKKLQIRGILEAKRPALAKKNVLESDAYATLRRESADELILDEIADGMKAKATETEEVAQKMYENYKKLDTSWDGNGALHPDGKSSKQAYKDKHFAPEPVKAKSTLFDAKGLTLKKVEEAPKGAANNASSGGTTNGTANNTSTNGASNNAAKDVGNKAPKNKNAVLALLDTKAGKIGAAVGAAAILGGTIIYLFNKKPKSKRVSPQGDSFSSTMQNKQIS